MRTHLWGDSSQTIGQRDNCQWLQEDLNFSRYAYETFVPPRGCSHFVPRYQNQQSAYWFLSDPCTGTKGCPLYESAWNKVGI